MLYKPNYCCSCGEKIERLEWHIWTNRRFCELCETEHQFDEWLKKIVPGIFILFGIFGIGSLFTETDNSNIKLENKSELVTSENIDRESAKPKTLKKVQTEGLKPEVKVKNEDLSKKDVGTNTQNLPLEVDTASKKVVRVRDTQKSSVETVYFCGAATKKGSPCSRKVKGGGRCWQHEGRDAILSDQELLAETK